jgi:hypothetical protein
MSSVIAAVLLALGGWFPLPAPQTDAGSNSDPNG